jgi:hypothetical protein
MSNPANPPAEAADAPLPIGGVNGTSTDLRMRVPGVADQVEMNDGLARLYMEQCCQFLSQIMTLTSAVIESVSVGQVRKIVAAEVAVTGSVIDLDGKVTGALETPACERDSRKLPRGRKHPLILLLQCGLQAARMLQKITEALNPNAHNRQTLEQKQQRERDKEAERNFKALLKGS